MSVSFTEVVEAAGYDLTTLEDAKWLLSVQGEAEEMFEKAKEMVDEAEELENERLEREYQRRNAEE